jgi:dTDP-L-rhamnose 4-epimerase
VAIKDQDAIIHLAAETGTAQSMYEIKKYIDVNIGGTALIADVLVNNKNRVKKIIVASSRAIYGEGKYYCIRDGIVYPGPRKVEHLSKGDFKCKCPICGGAVKLMATTENSRLLPTSIYGITKQSQEQITLMVAKSIGISAVALRYQNVYGPGQSLVNPYTGILSIFSNQIKNNKDINVFEDGMESRDFVYIDDVVEATFLSLISKEMDQEVFNVGADVPVNVLTIAETLKKLYNSRVKINISGNYRIGDIRHNYADLTHISNKLGYRPKIKFELGIKNFCNWVDKQQVTENKLEPALEELKLKGFLK